ncbi:MAG: T9SS type A sorting domain-containing protein [candidate division Zixibacteria bacterium]|nr:T9SS type A sorting domain-containing protein [candidate division Zixibacteria bacterium]
MLVACDTISAARLKLPVFHSFWLPERNCPVVVPVTLDSLFREIGGFNLCVVERSPEFVVTSVEPGAFMESSGWEYLSWKRTAMPNELYSSHFDIVPFGANLIEITAFASVSSDYQATSHFAGESAELVKLTCLFSQSPWGSSPDCMSRPLTFVWRDCEDNVIYSRDLDTSFAADTISDGYGFPYHGLTFPGYGVPDSTCFGLSSQYLPAFDAINGAVDHVCVDCLDYVGDINLDGFRFTLADAVLLASYFSWGLPVFTISPPAQIAGTDINRDGLPLTVADLVLLIQIVSGFDNCADPPIPQNSFTQSREQFITSLCTTAKPALSSARAEIAVMRTDLGSALTLDVDQPIAGCYLKLVSESGASLTEEQLIALAPNAAIGAIGDTTTLLWVDDQGDEVLSAGRHQLVSVHDRDVLVVGVEVVDTQAGAMAVFLTGNLPADYSLAQNIPNPFNPQTSIKYSLPVASHVLLDIVNVNGQRVITIVDGCREAGRHEVTWRGVDADGRPVASGIYFYLLQAEGYTQTRKMLLLK